LKIAGIDIGTNSVRYLAVESHGTGPPEIIARGLATPRLGEGLVRAGYLSDEAISRTISELSLIKKKLASLGVSEFRCVGTEALRLAENGEIFIRRAAEIGLRITILTGEEEARLIYAGATDNLDLSTGGYLLADVGGGSTEIITVTGGEEPSFVSLPMGCVRLKELNSPNSQPRSGDLSPPRKVVYFGEVATGGSLKAAATSVTIGQRIIPLGKRDPGHEFSTQLECNLMKEHCRNLLKNNLRADDMNPADTTLIGLGGTFTTLAAVSIGLADYDGDRIHGLNLEGKEIERIGKRLRRMSLEERKLVDGLESSRADIIIYGIIIVQSIMDHLGFKDVTISDHGLLLGLIH